MPLVRRRYARHRCRWLKHAFCRETSNKALAAINDANLTPFLMAFLISRDKIPLKTVLAAGALLSVNHYVRLKSLTSKPAQCLYVLSDDNDPTARTIRKTQAYTSCLLSIVKSPESNGSTESSNGMVIDKPSDSEQRTTLKVLACG